MAERRVAEVVAERCRLGQILVEAQRASHAAGDAAYLERVCQPRAEMIALRSDEDLCLLLEAAKGLAVDDAVPVALERRSQRTVLVIRLGPPPRLVRAHGERRQRGCLDLCDARGEALCDWSGWVRHEEAV